MNTLDIRLKSIVLFMAWVWLGCAPRPGAAPTPSRAADTPHAVGRFDHLYDRTTRRFEHADFYKPDPSHEADPLFPLAPLIVIERTDFNPGAADRPGVNLPSLVLHTAEAEVHFGPVLRRQILFHQLPFLAQHRTDASTTSDLLVSPPAVRFTLTELGAPMIAEILPGPSGESSGPLVVFVSRTLEDAARRQYGSPLPDRRYACEPPMESMPAIVVAGVFEDPPVVSGPYLYFADKGQTLTTVLCRCSPSQVGDFVTNQYYQLLPLTSDAHLDSEFSFADPSPLSEFLRMPDALP